MTHEHASRRGRRLTATVTDLSPDSHGRCVVADQGFDWADDAGPHRESHVFGAGGDWTVPTGRNVQTRWVEFEPVARGGAK